VPPELTSAAAPPAGPGDHMRGVGPEAILYVDLACPVCAASWARIRALPLSLVARHFPISSKRPRSPALHAAAEAAGRQGAFWEMCDSIYADQSRTDDPHLWERCDALGLDLDRFERDRRSAEVAARIERDFRSGVRAGVTGTPAAFVDGRPTGADVVAALADLSSSRPTGNESSERDGRHPGGPKGIGST
jgi:protein-disulfide isomerase